MKSLHSGFHTPRMLTDVYFAVVAAATKQLTAPKVYQLELYRGFLQQEVLRMNVIVENPALDAVLHCQHSLSHDDPCCWFRHPVMTIDEVQQALAGIRILHNQSKFSRMFKPLVESDDEGACGFSPHHHQQRHFCHQRFGMPGLERSSRQKVSWVKISSQKSLFSSKFPHLHLIYCHLHLNNSTHTQALANLQYQDNGCCRSCSSA